MDPVNERFGYLDHSKLVDDSRFKSGSVDGFSLPDRDTASDGRAKASDGRATALDGRATGSDLATDLDANLATNLATNLAHVVHRDDLEGFDQRNAVRTLKRPTPQMGLTEALQGVVSSFRARPSSGAQRESSNQALRQSMGRWFGRTASPASLGSSGLADQLGAEDSNGFAPHGRLLTGFGRHLRARNRASGGVGWAPPVKRAAFVLVLLGALVVGGLGVRARLATSASDSTPMKLPMSGGTASLSNSDSGSSTRSDGSATGLAAPSYGSSSTENVANSAGSTPSALGIPGLLPILTVPAPPVTTTTILITVHAAGAVKNPGVFVFDGMPRVDDVVNAAGGLAEDADDSGLNLAAPVVDGQRVFVPAIGKTVPSVLPVEVAVAAGLAQNPGDTSTGIVPGKVGASSGAPIDLNTATAEQLDLLPGVGPATAASILAYRTEHGRFKSVGELMEVRGIGEAKFAAIRPKVKV